MSLGTHSPQPFSCPMGWTRKGSFLKCHPVYQSSYSFYSVTLSPSTGLQVPPDSPLVGRSLKKDLCDTITSSFLGEVIEQGLDSTTVP